MMETHSLHLFCMMSLMFLLLRCQDFLQIADEPIDSCRQKTQDL